MHNASTLESTGNETAHMKLIIIPVYKETTHSYKREYAKMNFKIMGHKERKFETQWDEYLFGNIFITGLAYEGESENENVGTTITQRS